MADLALNLGETLDQKILGFKSDPEKMKEIHEFLNELFEKACIEAENRQGAGSVGMERKTKFDTIGLQRMNVVQIFFCKRCPVFAVEDADHNPTVAKCETWFLTCPA